jgi:uncharacterized phage protein (TIGR01671 family)
MNREIKFRARDTKNNKWLDAVPSMEYLLDDDDHSISHHDIDEESSIYTYPKNLLGDTFDDRIIWQQYTGLKDKNGKEIYEGDLVQYNQNSNYDGMNFEVIWSYVSFGWVLKSKNGDYLSNQITPTGPRYNFLEIAGNIFENPELLK